MKNLTKKGLLMSALICGNVLLGGTTAFAEEVHEYDLDAMVVTATRTMKEIQEVPSSVSVVTAKEIENRNVTSVQEALQYMPGVYMDQSSQGAISLRGFGSTNVLVLVDGVQQNDTYEGSVNYNSIPVENIERIEVVRGAGSSIYGGHAVGGVINITTKEAKAGTHIDAAVSYGSYKTWKKSLNVNAKINDKWSFGLGFDAVYAKAKIERYAGDLGQIVAGSGALPPALAGQVAKIPAATQIAHLNGNAWGFGWNAGILYELDKNNRYGFTYRSEVKIDFDGNYRSSLPAAYNQILGNFGLPAGTNGQTTGGSLTLNLPEMWELSGYNRVAPQWAVHYSLTYTSWSQFQELKATGSNGQTLFYKEEGFKDAYRLALGTTYYYDDNWTFRTGIAFDDSPVPANNRSISIPDQDRLWLSAGTTYAFNKDASVDVGLSYMHGQHVEIKEGPYTFRSEGTAWLYGANFNYRF